MNSMKILLVDDSKSARYALRLQLQRYGVTVETEDAAESALERIRETPPDAVFMDHTMPGMNGFEALDILKTAPATKHIPVVMCTSNEDPEFFAQAKKKGALDILSKSTAPEKLGSLLEKLQLAVSPPVVAPAPAAIAEPDSGYAAVAEPQPAAPDTLTEAQVDERIRTLTPPLLDGLAERLAQDLIAETQQTLVSRLDEEAERLQKRFVKVQSEQAQLTTTRLINEVLPLVVQQRLDEERQNTAHMLQELIDTSLDSLLEQPRFIRRIQDSVEATATNAAEQTVTRRAQEIAETVASQPAGEVTDKLAPILTPRLRPHVSDSWQRVRR